MKILFYINAIHHGGAERVMVNLSKFLSADNECILVTSFKDDWEYPLDKSVKRLILSQEMSTNFIKRNVKLTLLLRKVIKEEKPDIILSFMAEPNFRNIVANIGLDRRVIISIRNDPNREYPNWLFRAVARCLYPLADGVVFQTENAQKWFSSKIQQKSCIIFNPVDEVFYQKKYSGVRKNIVTTGRLTSQKNHILLIDAFSKICDRVPDNLIIYGEGELRKSLEDHIKELGLSERVLLPGATTNVADTIRKAKLFVLSSDYEGMPNSLMEAMALGLACVSTDCPCGGPKALLKGKYITPVKNSDGLGELMLALLIDDNKRKEAEMYSSDCAQQFIPDRINENWKSYFMTVISRK